MSMTLARFPPTETSRRGRCAAVCGAACGDRDARAKRVRAQPHSVNTIPAHALDALLRNCLRVGIVDCEPFFGCESELVSLMGLFIHPRRWLGNGFFRAAR